MFLLVGLGNPGKQYSNNRHNVGFKVIDKIVIAYNLEQVKDKFDSHVFTGAIAGHKIIAIKPNSFMNLSGKAVASFVRYHKISLDKVVVIHDDIDLAIGKVKIKLGGGAGGHNGLKSIDNLVGASYSRIRLGVNHPGHRDLVADHVLEDFAHGYEQEKIAQIIRNTANNIELLLGDKHDLFLSNVNQIIKES